MLENKEFALVKIKNEPEHEDKAYPLFNGIKRDNIYYYALNIDNVVHLVDCDRIIVLETSNLGAMLHIGWCRLKEGVAHPGFTQGEFYEVIVDAEVYAEGEGRHILTQNDNGYYDFFSANYFDISTTRDNILRGKVL